MARPNPPKYHRNRVPRADWIQHRAEFLKQRVAKDIAELLALDAAGDKEWPLCASCGHIAQDHDDKGKCERPNCSRCRGYVV